MTTQIPDNPPPQGVGSDNTPFFILGAPRSGTTLVRDILKAHARLASPEETFYFRWASPFGTKEYITTYAGNPTIKQHRSIDGLSEEAFQAGIDTSASRKELMDFHGRFVARQAGKARWFDKTPQNVYGAFLLASYYPNSKFICIWRHPLNVAASLFLGRQINAHTLHGAINYWTEAARIMLEFKRLYGSRLIDMRYEQLAFDPQATAAALLNDLGEDPQTIDFPWHTVQGVYDRYLEAFSAEQIAQVLDATRDLRELACGGVYADGDGEQMASADHAATSIPGIVVSSQQDPDRPAHSVQT